MIYLNPIAIFWMFILTAFILHKLRKKKISKIVFIITITGLFIFTVTPLPVWLIRNLEQQYPVYKPSGTDKLPVLVLGNYHADDTSLYPTQKLSAQSLQRVSEGIRIYNLQSTCPIAFSGFAVNNKVPTGTVGSEAAVSLGVSAKDTIILPAPRNTYEEALAYKKRFGTKNRFILVTNATHMPRAMMVFQKLGMKPIAAPTGFLIKEGTKESVYNCWPSSMKLFYTEAAMYEYSAQLYYKWFR